MSIRNYLILVNYIICNNRVKFQKNTLIINPKNQLDAEQKLIS